MDLLQPTIVECPYCGENIEVLVDCSIREQEYVEDCQVCCQPILLTVACSDTGDVRVTAGQENP